MHCSIVFAVTYRPESYRNNKGKKDYSNSIGYRKIWYVTYCIFFFFTALTWPLRTSCQYSPAVWISAPCQIAPAAHLCQSLTLASPPPGWTDRQMEGGKEGGRDRQKQVVRDNEPLWSPIHTPIPPQTLEHCFFTSHADIDDWGSLPPHSVYKPV